MSRKRATDQPVTITEYQLSLVTKARDRATHGGGTWQAWQRILDVLEDAKLAQDAIAEQARIEPTDAAAVDRLAAWTTGDIPA